MNARSALFDLYGDHLRARGGRAPVAALVRLLAPLGVAAPAVRTAVSRMVRQGWLEPVRLPDGPGLRPDARAPYAGSTTPPPASTAPSASDWDGTWHLMVTDLPRRAQPARPAARRPDLPRLRPARRRHLGRPPLVGRGRRACSRSRRVRAERFAARHDGDSLGPGPPRLGRRGPGPVLRPLAGRRRASWSPAAGTDPDDEQAFAARSRLVHEWRKFLFLDPGLPRELLPRDWPGDKAADFFDAASSRLLPGCHRGSSTPA